MAQELLSPHSPGLPCSLCSLQAPQDCGKEENSPWAPTCGAQVIPAARKRSSGKSKMCRQTRQPHPSFMPHFLARPHFSFNGFFCKSLFCLVSSSFHTNFMIPSAELCTRFCSAITKTNGITIIQALGMAIINTPGFTGSVQLPHYGFLKTFPDSYP